MGRKRKEDVILNLLPSSDRAPSGPETSSYSPKRANNSVYNTNTESRSFERPTSDIVREYVNLLKAGTGYDGSPYMWLGDGLNACFVMRKHVEDKASGKFVGLSQAEYVHLYSIPMKLRGSEHPVNFVMCDCSEMETARNFLQGLQGGSHTAEEVIAPDLPLDPNRCCLHVKVFHELMRRNLIKVPEEVAVATVDDLQYGSAEPVVLLGNESSKVFSFSASKKVYSRTIFCAKKLEKVACQRGECKRNRHHCPHVHDFQTWIDEQDDARKSALGFQEVAPVYRTREPNLCEPVSHCRVPLDFIAPQTSRRMSPLHSASWIRPCTMCVTTGKACNHCVPDRKGLCECGSPWDARDPVVEGWKEPKAAKLMGIHCALMVNVYYRRCSSESCDKKRAYNGLADGIFCHSSESFFLHEVMFGYIDAMSISKMPFNAYHGILKKQYSRARSPVPLCSDDTLKHALQDFIRHLDINYAEGFKCPICSELPAADQIVIMDGKTMGLRKACMPAPSEPTKTGTAPPIKASTYAYLAGNNQLRELRAMLRRWAHGEPFSSANIQKLKREARKHAPELEQAVRYILRDHTLANTMCPVEYRRFLKSIATDYPISTLIPSNLALPVGGETVCALERIIRSKCITPRDKALIQRYCPAIFDVVSKCKWTTVPEALHPLLSRLITLARLPGTSTDTDHLGAVNGLPNKENLVCMPNHPVCRPLRHYGEKHDGSGDSCQKCVKRCPGLTPGIFTCFCPHGICLGFSIMERFEGPSTAFELLFQRFPESPGTVIYDNACNLSKYCLRREPAFFAQTDFRIDRVHWKGHVGCHEGYNMDAYPNDTPVLGGRVKLGQLNSQVCEQANSTLDYISTQTKFMLPENFLAYTRLFLYSRNLAKIEKLN